MQELMHDSALHYWYYIVMTAISFTRGCSLVYICKYYMLYMYQACPIVYICMYISKSKFLATPLIYVCIYTYMHYTVNSPQGTCSLSVPLLHQWAIQQYIYSFICIKSVE